VRRSKRSPNGSATRWRGPVVPHGRRGCRERTRKAARCFARACSSRGRRGAGSVLKGQTKSTRSRAGVSCGESPSRPTCPSVTSRAEPFWAPARLGPYVLCLRQGFAGDCTPGEPASTRQAGRYGRCWHGRVRLRSALPERPPPSSRSQQEPRHLWCNRLTFARLPQGWFTLRAGGECRPEPAQDAGWDAQRLQAPKDWSRPSRGWSVPVSTSSAHRSTLAGVTPPWRGRPVEPGATRARAGIAGSAAVSMPEGRQARRSCIRCIPFGSGPRLKAIAGSSVGRERSFSPASRA